MSQFFRIISIIKFGGGNQGGQGGNGNNYDGNPYEFKPNAKCPWEKPVNYGAYEGKISLLSL